MTRKKIKANDEKSITTKDMDRRQRGKTDGSVMFPVAPSKNELSEEYIQWLADLKSSIAQTRLQMVLSSNSAMVLL